MSGSSVVPFADARACWLALDASTYAGTVAVVRGCDVVVEREVAMRGEREERLMPTVVEALGAAGVTPGGLAGVVCGAGPGSFTSLRIAASIAKGIAQATGTPLYAAPSLALLVGAVHPPLAPGRYLAALDALRGESYAAVVSIERDARGGGMVVGYDYRGVVPTGGLAELAHHGGATLLHGEGPRDAGEGVAPRARGVVALAQLIGEAGPVDLDVWEPDYGRKAEAQVKWEAAPGRALPSAVDTADVESGA
jgi:tRNA threonylcarbamoyladenosine biosynthesis protein TsaB